MMHIKYLDKMFHMCDNNEIIESFKTVGVLFDCEDRILLKWGNYETISTYTENYRKSAPAPLIENIMLMEFSAEKPENSDEICQKFCDVLNKSIDCGGSYVNNFRLFLEK